MTPGARHPPPLPGAGPGRTTIGCEQMTRFYVCQASLVSAEMAGNQTRGRCRPPAPGLPDGAEDQNQ